MMMNTCKNCNTTLVGRSDKKYCNDLCKSRFHNKANKETNTGVFDKNEMTNKRSSVNWLIEKFSSVLRDTNFSDEQNFDLIKYIEQAKAMEKKQHGKTWDDAMENMKARGGNDMRAWTDFDDYYNETFGGNNE